MRRDRNDISVNNHTLFAHFQLYFLKVTIGLSSDWYEPASNDQNDVNAALIATDFHIGWFANPVFVNGDYPVTMKDQVANKSDSTSRLPEFTEDEKATIAGKYYFAQWCNLRVLSIVTSCREYKLSSV